MKGERRGWRSEKALSALGVVAAMVVAVNANVLVSRFYARWDVTSEGLYTLSPATTSILRSLDTDVRITVLLARTDVANGDEACAGGGHAPAARRLTGVVEEIVEAAAGRQEQVVIELEQIVPAIPALGQRLRERHRP